MKKYLLFFNVALHAQLTYRGALLIRALRDLLWVISFVLLWSALFKQKAEIGGFTFQAMITYYILAKLIDQIYSYEPSRIMSRDIITGDLSNFLTKPLKYFGYLFFLAAGRRTARNLPSFAIAISVFIFAPQWVTFPPDLISFAVFLISAFLSWILLFEFVFLLGTISFWISETSNLRTAFEQGVLLLGGLWIPLNLFPKQLSDFLGILPFRYLYYQLINIYQGKVQGFDLLSSVLIQTIWIIILFGVCYLTWKKGVKRYEAYGK